MTTPVTTPVKTLAASKRSSWIANLLQRLPDRMRGKQRVSRALIRQLLDPSAPRWVTGDFGCRYHLPNLTEQVAFEIFINGIVEPETVAFIDAQLSRGSWLLDIGANIGGISVPLAVQRPDLRCVCVEASPMVFRHLQDNIRGNGLQDRIQPHHVALSNQASETIQFYAPSDEFGKGSMSPCFTAVATQVPNMSLQRFVESLPARPELIKIDVEGYERQVFESGAHYLRAERPGIVLEFCDWAEQHAGNAPGDAQRLLLDLGYQLVRMEAPQSVLQAPITEGFAMLLARRPS